MRLLLPLVALGLLGTACAVGGTVPPAAAQTSLPPLDAPGSGISVTGEGRVAGTPDVLTVDLGVSVLGDTAQQAIADAADLAARVITILEQAGVAPGDRQTTSYAVHPEYDYSGERQRLVGYRVTNALAVKLRDLQQAGALLDQVTAAGGDDVVVHGIRFDLEDNQAMLEDARTAAWNDARAKAEQLAALAGVTLGDPLSMVERLDPISQPIYARTEALDETATPIEPGEVDVVVRVDVRFAIGG
ncbi:MAG: SIMPL domain-containing protein [Acidimicrobiia bacterium]|nr:SIMPL domain-containing protein [Acidimicrobiia bacterium]